MTNSIMNISKRVIVFAISIIIASAFVCTKNTNAVSAENEELYQQMVDAVNIFRESFGCEPLELDPTLCDMAEVRAEEISSVFSHTRPDGTSSSTIFNDFNVKKTYSGENIAYYYRKSISDVMEAWIDSEGHRANLINADYDCIGIGLYECNGYYYWTQIFSSAAQQEDLFAKISYEDNEDDLFTLGDVNLDGKIDASDSSETMSIYMDFSSGEETDATEVQMKAADVNCDGVIDASDSSSILRYYSMLSMGVAPEF